MKRTSVSRMALYSDLGRVRQALSRPGWTLEDAETFAHMHYLGAEALDHAAEKLGLAAGQVILDLGSGFGGTGRYLHAHYGCAAVGIELQRPIAAVAETLNAEYNARCGRQAVMTIVGDFLKVPWRRQFAHAISLLAILHVPLPRRERLWQKLRRHLLPGGRIYIEDFFQRHEFSAPEEDALDRIVSCPGLPTKGAYAAALEKAGFDVEFEDVSVLWTDFVRARAEAYGKTEAPSPGLLLFYQTMSGLFQGKNLGGAKITATKGGNQP
ncbi:MAG: methyltransferase domain-containing protein [Elusimicrobia bacterium]|nr:methyltransferase domain-containing protein [Elusimicrobiota bacterium]